MLCNFTYFIKPKIYVLHYYIFAKKKVKYLYICFLYCKCKLSIVLFKSIHMKNTINLDFDLLGDFSIAVSQRQFPIKAGI